MSCVNETTIFGDRNFPSATILKVKVAKRRLIEKMSLERCDCKEEGFLVKNTSGCSLLHWIRVSKSALNSDLCKRERHPSLTQSRPGELQYTFFLIKETETKKDLSRYLYNLRFSNLYIGILN